MGYNLVAGIVIIILVMLIIILIYSGGNKTEDESLSQALHSLMVRKEDIAQISYLVHTWIAERVGKQESACTTYDNIKLRVKLYSKSILYNADYDTIEHYTNLYMKRLDILSEFIDAIVQNKCYIGNKEYNRRYGSEDVVGANVEILNDGVFRSDSFNLIMEKDIICGTDDTKAIIEKMKTNCEELTSLFMHKKNHKSIESTLESEARILFSQAYFYVKGKYKSSISMMSRHLVESREFIKLVVKE